MPLRRCLIGLIIITNTAVAELNDITQAPNTVNAGIKKSLTEQIGMGRGDINTPDSSIYLINRDPFRAIVRGRQLFQRKFQIKQGFGPRVNDGEGDLNTNGALGAGLADSCAACHARPRGGAGDGGDVFTRPDSRDAPHLFGLGLIEMLADEITADLRAVRDSAIETAQSTNSNKTVYLKSKGIQYGSITAHPDGSVDNSHLKGIDDDLRVKPFFAEGSDFSIRSFSMGAFNAEMGLQSHDPDHQLAFAGNNVITPSGLSLAGNKDAVSMPPVSDSFADGDSDGISNEMPPELLDYMEFYLLNYFKPAQYKSNRATRKGKYLMEKIGCTTCHKTDLVINKDRRVADVETAYDRENGGFNHLYATAEAKFDEIDDGSGYPALKQPKLNSFIVKNVYADFKRHDLGSKFWERNFDGSYQKEFMTEPLWGVGTTAPYGHDGRSINLHEVILRHGGEAASSRKKYAYLWGASQRAIVSYLQSLVLFPPPDTASNLDPGDKSDPMYPQESQGSISLTPLFNDPTDLE
ncbi:MAG: thiol oxidoreductase-like protein [endosymbiont of Galathealinum brachiosum]|uniref:Thiol oxidoreductase-like protein n=1 Tax=endosymbiont of Galathealinum brachiosum TaxID=2200906 RepID=A0A370DG64_9GAMM|nr:MAG: thiol oxidoreductase-like protein [endosymbiont of Galathealinum brachiosum]